MATEAENIDSLKTTRSNIIAQLATVVTDTPEYSVDGQMVKPGRTYLLEQLKAVNELITALEGGFSVFSAGDTY